MKLEANNLLSVSTNSKGSDLLKLQIIRRLSPNQGQPGDARTTPGVQPFTNLASMTPVTSSSTTRWSARA
jgi:hypothetical protein